MSEVKIGSTWVRRNSGSYVYTMDYAADYFDWAKPGQIALIRYSSSGYHVWDGPDCGGMVWDGELKTLGEDKVFQDRWKEVVEIGSKWKRPNCPEPYVLDFKYKYFPKDKYSKKSVALIRRTDTCDPIVWASTRVKDKNAKWISMEEFTRAFCSTTTWTRIVEDEPGKLVASINSDDYKSEAKPAEVIIEDLPLELKPEPCEGMTNVTVWENIMNESINLVDTDNIAGNNLIEDIKEVEANRMAELEVVAHSHVSAANQLAIAQLEHDLKSSTETTMAKVRAIREGTGIKQPINWNTVWFSAGFITLVLIDIIVRVF